MPRHYEDSETRRHQIAQAALETIAQDGVARFTTRAVAARVGLSDGSLFRHFASKEEIVLEAMAELDIEFQAGLVDTGDPWEDLERFFRHRARFVGEQASVGRLVFSDELLHLAGEPGRERIEAWRRASVAYLLARLQALREAGRVRQDLDVGAMSLFVQGVLLTFAMQASLGRAGSREQVQGRIEHAWSALRTVLTS